MILGIDPWIRKLGFALIHPDLSIVEAGILKLDLKATTKENKRLEQYQRMLEIKTFFSNMLKKHPNITTISIEKYFFTQFNKSNAEFVYGSRGVILTLATEQHKIIKEYTPLQLKKNITGNGKAGKQLVQKIIMKLFNLKNLPAYDDAADALGLAYIWKN